MLLNSLITDSWTIVNRKHRWRLNQRSLRFRSALALFRTKMVVIPTPHLIITAIPFWFKTFVLWFRDWTSTNSALIRSVQVRRALMHAFFVKVTLIAIRLIVDVFVLLYWADASSAENQFLVCWARTVNVFDIKPPWWGFDAVQVHEAVLDLTVLDGVFDHVDVHWCFFNLLNMLKQEIRRR